MSKPIAIAIWLGLVSFGAGFLFGQWREYMRHEVLGLGEAIGRSFFLSQRADLQYCEADYDAAHDALTAWLTHLEETRPVDGKYRDPLMNERGIAIDKTLALGRLALIEEQRGRRDLGEPLWVQAQQEARNASWKDTSLEGIRAVILRLDNCDKLAPKP